MYFANTNSGLSRPRINYFFTRRFSAWVGEGNNWCAPYKGWQKIYDNSPLEIVKKQGYGNKQNLILGKSTFHVKVNYFRYPRSG